MFGFVAVAQAIIAAAHLTGAPNIDTGVAWGALQSAFAQPFVRPEVAAFDGDADIPVYEWDPYDQARLLGNLVQAWLDIAAARPRFGLDLWSENERPTIRPSLTIAPHDPVTGTAFHVIGVELMNVVAGHLPMMWCDGCGTIFIPRRKPHKDAKLNFCSKCRADGIQNKIYQRQRRAKTKKVGK